jgi:2-amino-4-hydroxy-6-hydroxymethyldihydropteridine diphosphokinase
MSEPHRAYVALGSNLGDRAARLARARDALAAAPDVRVVGASRIWETEPVGPPGQGPYLNAVLALETRLSARALLERLLAIERAVGRDRARESERWGPRVLDLDLLLYDDVRLREPGLVVPHPRLQERAFVMEPLAELAPDLVHPVLGGTLAAHRAALRPAEGVRPWAGEACWKAGRRLPADPSSPAAAARD